VRLGGYISHIRTRRKVIALTLDEDLRPGMYATRKRTRWYDPRIIRLLERTGTHATVFMNGLFAKAYPTVFRRLARNPNIELANHSWDHQGWQSYCGPNDPMLRPPMTKTKEVRMTERIVRDMTGIRLRYFRYPAGCHSSTDVRLVVRLGEQPIGWSCYFGDGLDYTTAQQIRNVQQTCGRGGIVITHLNGPPYHEGVYEALRVLIPWWKAHGWEVVTVGELLGHPTR
jgi:peptidoglycan/xylan/chitin deacetylase (PgdA/CDA1 family)